MESRHSPDFVHPDHGVSDRWLLVSRYLLGGLGVDEHAEAERWIAEVPEREEEIDYLRQVMAPVKRAHVRNESIEQALAAVTERFEVGHQQGHARANTAPAKSARTHHRVPLQPRRGWRSFVLVAGTAAAMVFAWIWFGNTTVPNEVNPARLTYETTSAQHAVLDLGEGSRVILAPETQFQFFTTRNGERHAVLTGEAYFDVVTHNRMPFVVQTGKIETRVLGTEFSVRRYAEDRLAEIVVVSGKVATAAVGASVIITPGTMTYVGDSTVSTRVVDANAMTQWIHGRLAFQDAKVSDVLRTLSRWTGYEFRLADSLLARQSVNASFAIDRPTEMLVNLRDLLDVKLVSDGKVVTLRPR